MERDLLLTRNVSFDTNLWMFENKILNNVLYLNKKIFIFNKKDPKLCFYCRLLDKTTNHIFVECKFALKLWNNLKDYCQCGFDLPFLNPPRATFGSYETDPDMLTLLNYILLLFK